MFRLKKYGLLCLAISGCFTLLAGDATSAGVPAKKATAPAAKSKTGSTKQPVKSSAKAPVKNSGPSATAAKGPKPIPYSGPPVLEPGRFFGPAMIGYASAKAAPGVMANLFCYCGCDISDSHSYLIDCFTSTHGVDCHICQEEAVLALKLFRDGASLSEIQKKVDQDYSKEYPFQEDSPAYKKYKATRLWTKAEPTETPATTSSGADWKPVLKPGMKAGECCGEHGKDEKKSEK